MATVRVWGSLLTGIALVVAGCGSQAECNDATGTYAVSGTFISGTDCGSPFPNGVKALTWGGVPSSDCEGSRTVSPDRCDLDIDLTCHTTTKLGRRSTDASWAP